MDQDHPDLLLMRRKHGIGDRPQLPPTFAPDHAHRDIARLLALLTGGLMGAVAMLIGSLTLAVGAFAVIAAAFFLPLRWKS